MGYVTLGELLKLSVLSLLTCEVGDHTSACLIGTVLRRTVPGMEQMLYKCGLLLSLTLLLLLFAGPSIVPIG